MQTRITKQCKRILHQESPSLESPCEYCGSGPCALLFKASNRRGRPPRKPKRGKQLPKQFPYLRYAMTEWEYTESGASYAWWRPGPTPNAMSYSVWSELPVLYGGIPYNHSYIVELNRLSHGYGTQVLQQKTSVPGYYLSGPSLAHLIRSPGDEPGAEWFSECSEAFLVSMLMHEINGSPFEHSNQHPHLALRSEHDVAEAVAFNAMRPAFKTGFSALNFLLELDDVSKPLENVLRGLESLRDIVVRFNSGMRGRRKMPLASHSANELLNGIADWHLTWEFGIAPMIRDMETVCKTMERLDKNVQRFMDGAKSLGERRHFKSFIEPTNEYKDALRRQVSVNLGNHTVVYDIVLDGFEPIPNGTPSDHMCYTATMDFTYSCETLGNISPYVAALYQSLGIKPDASILWNAIPFSFLIDWFVDVGAFLRKYASLDIITSRVTIHQWLTGLKSRPRWKCVPVGATVNVEGASGPILHTLPTLVVQSELYSRLVRNPDIDQLVTLNSQTPDGLTIKRGLLSASLIKNVLFR